jgi:hypothetical protein
MKQGASARTHEVHVPAAHDSNNAKMYNPAIKIYYLIIRLLGCCAHGHRSNHVWSQNGTNVYMSK